MVYRRRSLQAGSAKRLDRPGILLFIILLAVCLAPQDISPLRGAAAQGDDIWLSIDTRALTLAVMRGDDILKVYENIAIGSNGPTREKQVMDEKTPLGEYRINNIRPSKRFQLFLSIDYPSMDDAQKAFDEDRIDSAQYSAVRKAWSIGKAPPQDTRLGGHLGIHGLGAGSLEIHSNFNWTNGCIAVTNEQVEELAVWARIGTRVSIR